MILQYSPGSIDKLESGLNTVLGWVEDLRTNGTFRAHTQFTLGMDNAAGNATLVEEGTLRIDRQRVVGVNQRTTPKTKYLVKVNNKFQEFDTEADAKEAGGNKKIQTKTINVTVADYVWTLFAVQSGKDSGAKSHNRVFVLNNHNLVNTYDAEQWRKIFKTSVQNKSAMIITSTATLLPSGVGKATEYTP